jgi:predicted alpha/beta-hydrolase family hydrolase
VIRHDFPYRREGRKAPDRAPKAIADVVAHVPGPGWVLGGRSFGGRMCSMAVAEGLPAAGLVLISYPLHPPGQPEKLRTEHLPNIEVPCLFISGTRDTFGSPVPVDGKGHDLRGADALLAATVADWLRLLG